MDFTLLKDTKVYSDCSFDSKKIFEIKKNTVLHKLYSNGPWLRIKHNDTLVWLYPFDKNKLIISPINAETDKSNDLKIGSVVYIKPNQPNNKYLDKQHKLIDVIGDNNRKKFFIIDSVKTIDGYYKMRDENNNYCFIDENDIDKSIDADSSSLISTYSLLSLFSNDDDEKNKKEEENKSPYEIKDELTNFGEYGKELKDAYNARVNTEYKNKVDLTKVNLTNLRSVFGMPYQYMPNADLRMDTDGNIGSTMKVTELQAIGMKYREKILSRMPLLVMMPGVVNFMPNYGYKAKETAIKNLMTESESYTNNKAFEFLVEKNAKSRSSYYTFYPAWTEYFNYVNKMCAVAAVFMGISHVRLPYADGSSSDELGNYRWQKALPSSLNSTFYKGSCAFYVNSETQIQESYNNSTTQSQLASKVNSMSEKARELAFLSGGASDLAASIGNIASTAASMTAGNMEKLINRGASKIAVGEWSSKFRQQGVVQAIMGGIGNACAGAKMQFPELWQDSTFSRDYSATIKLDSPDNDPLSVFLNIIVPLIHLTAFAAPRSTGLTTYASPFLVRAYYQGFFNVNMGIISSMEINKGAEGAWTYNNIPTVVEVRVNIHDLFATQTITIDANNSDTILGSLTNLDMLTNQPLMEYLANLCGVNYNEPEWNRLVDLAITLEKRKPLDFFYRIEDALNQGWNNWSNSVYRDAINSNGFGLVSLVKNYTIDGLSEAARKLISGS